MGDAPDGIAIRLFRDVDGEQVRRFTCANPGEKWTREAQNVIRESPDAITDGIPASIAVAVDAAGAVVGAIVFGIDPENEKHTIFSLGVHRSRRREGIGTRLKVAALAEMVGDSPRVDVYSQVHRRNTAMLGLNEKLGAVSERDPDDSELLLHMVAAEPQEQDMESVSEVPPNDISRRSRT